MLIISISLYFIVPFTISVGMSSGIVSSGIMSSVIGNGTVFVGVISGL